MTEDLTALASLLALARTLLAAIRRRRVRPPEPDAVTLIVKGPAIDLEMRLPADVRASEILRCLMPLLNRIAAQVSQPAPQRQPMAEEGFEDEVQADFEP
jgi:hypothetical protein